MSKYGTMHNSKAIEIEHGVHVLENTALGEITPHCTALFQFLEYQIL